LRALWKCHGAIEPVAGTATASPGMSNAAPLLCHIGIIEGKTIFSPITWVCFESDYLVMTLVIENNFGSHSIYFQFSFNFVATFVFYLLYFVFHQASRLPHAAREAVPMRGGAGGTADKGVGQV
jgi:hypothetical protein